MRPPIRPLNAEQLTRLIAVSRKMHPADVVLENVVMLNVYTCELLEVGYIGMYGNRIAYVGSSDLMRNDETKVIDASGYVLVPAYIEPHMHIFQFYNPRTMAEKALRLGTTAAVIDDLPFYLDIETNDFYQLMDEFASYPFKMFWSMRMDPQTYSPYHLPKFSSELMAHGLHHPFVLQGGELTAWVKLLNGDRQLAETAVLIRGLGKRIEGHLPGASVDTLNAGVAAGLGACHESLTAEDVIKRLRLGLYATIRMSSIREDLPEIVSGLMKEEGFRWSNRLMMTTDGASPLEWRDGFTNRLLVEAMKAGLDPVTAYRMVTLNPATYYGLDQEMGGIAPGRLADLLFLKDLTDPFPQKVMAEGQIVAENDKLTVELSLPKSFERVAMSDTIRVSDNWQVNEKHFRIIITENLSEVSFPVIHFVDSVITIVKQETFTIKDGYMDWHREGINFAAFIDKQGKWITQALVRNFADEIDAIASSATFNNHIIVVGRDVPSIVCAVNRLIRLRGGVVIAEAGKVVHEMALPLFSRFNDRSFDENIAHCEVLYGYLRSKGYRHLDPLVSLEFLTMTHLPRVRLTSSGLYSVKDAAILYPSVPLR